MGKRVLFISHDASRTGAPIILLRMLRWLKENSDLSFDILLRNGGELRDEFAAVADVFEYNEAGRKSRGAVPAGRAKFARRAARWMASVTGRKLHLHAKDFELLDLLRNRDIGLVYSNTITNGELLAKLAPLGYPTITHVHELEHWIRFETPQEVVAATCRHSQRFIAVSQAVKNTLVESLGLPADQVDVVHGFIPTEAATHLDRAAAKRVVCQSIGIPQDAFLVGASGTTDWRKSPDLFIQVARDAQQFVVDRPIHFLWIGGESSGPLWGKLQYDLERLGLKKTVHFLGAQADPRPLFASLDVFALTSREDPFPLVMLENAAAGNPVVCFDKTGGATEFVADECGVAVPYLDTKEMAQTIVRLLNDEKLRQRLGSRGQTKVRSFHNMDYGSNRVLQIIHRLLPNRHKPTLHMVSPDKSPESSIDNSVENRRRLIAWYLPQYHPIPENDLWWGKGFTEWTNVTKARPLFSGHYQPHLPADMGFYDLRIPEVRESQAEMAREHGIQGFCYYHYWFQGRRLLERPFQEVLDSGKPDFPFCLCWANENWSRNWDGGSREILVQQNYSREDDLRHIQWLLEAFVDPRYIRVDGRPLMLVYRAKQFPDIRQTIDLWQEAAIRRGLKGLYLCRVESFTDERDDPRPLGFDAAVEFQPDGLQLGQPLQVHNCIARWLRRHGLMQQGSAGSPPRVHDYAAIVRDMLGKQAVPYRRFPCVAPSWDNTSRRNSGALVLHNANPELYEHWLTEILRRPPAGPGDENLVFINAWNEWAEGNHLEPDRRFGRGYLEATRRALEVAGIDSTPIDTRTRVAA